MKNLTFQKADHWIESILRYPGIDEKELILRKDFWISGVFLLIIIGSATLAGYIFTPHLKILIAYGCFQVLLKVVLIAAGVFLHRDLGKIIFLNQILIAIVTFFFIIRLGGIAHSGGLILVGIFQIFFSLDFRKIRHTILLFAIYLVTVIMAGILDPLLTVPPEMTSGVNIALYVVNICWISCFALIYMLNFLKQSVRIEHTKSEKLIELDEVKTKMYTNITHEFRSPISVILSTTELITKNPAEWIGKGIDKIERNARILLHFVNQMLEIKKLEAGIMPVKLIQADIITYLKNLIELFFPVAESRNILLKFSADRQILVMDYDPDKLLQIVINIVANALKYTPSGGVVHVTVSSVSDKPQNLEIRISDNGPGIPEDQLPLIFERYFRVESTSAAASRGTGLGLTITRELIKLINGKINVSSIYGEGTEFTIILPVTNEAALADTPMPSEPGEAIAVIKPHSKRTVPQLFPFEDKPILLIVEDNDDVAEYLSASLSDEFRIVIGSDGKEAERIAMDIVPDIVLTDILMPEMDGLEFLDRIKHDRRTSHIPVVILTARADAETRLSGIKRGADAYLQKPFNREELELILSKLIESRKILQARYSSIEDFSKLPSGNRHYEDSFMKHVHDILSQHIIDETFDIHKLCKELAMSRTQLYRKFRTLTDMTVSQYLRTIRLNKAKSLITESDIKVSEVAYMTGFKNLSHFSRAFTAEFGINPSEIRKSAVISDGGIS